MSWNHPHLKVANKISHWCRTLDSFVFVLSYLCIDRGFSLTQEFQKNLKCLHEKKAEGKGGGGEGMLT